MIFEVKGITGCGFRDFFLKTIETLIDQWGMIRYLNRGCSSNSDHVQGQNLPPPTPPLENRGANLSPCITTYDIRCHYAVPTQLLEKNCHDG